MRIGTRGSQLALAQAEIVKDLVECNFGYKCEIEIISSLGDKDQITQLHSFRGMGIFTRTIENQLLDHLIDVAVHSLKDLPTENSEGLYLPALLKRDTPNDVLIIKESALKSDNPLVVKKGLRIATGSPRRQSQFIAFEPTCIPIDIRGNVNTRISRLNTSFIDGLIIAGAVFDRIKLELPEDLRIITLPLDIFPTAPGQGVIAIQARESEYSELQLLNHQDTSEAVISERDVLARIGGGCDISLGLSIIREDDKWKGFASQAPKNWNPSLPAYLSRTILEARTSLEIRQKLLHFYSTTNSCVDGGSTNNGRLRKIIIARAMADSINYSSTLHNNLKAVITSVPIFEYETNYTMLKFEKLINSWKKCSWLVLTSQRSVEFLYLLANLHPRGPIRIATIGSQTAKKVRSAGFPVHLVSEGSLFDLKNSLLEALEIYPGDVIFLHGDVITGYPGENLHSYQVYRTFEKDIDLPFKPDDLVVFSKKSAETILKNHGRDCTKRWVAIGETTGNYLRSEGMEVVVATDPTPEGVLQALLT